MDIELLKLEMRNLLSSKVFVVVKSKKCKIYNNKVFILLKKFLQVQNCKIFFELISLTFKNNLF